MTSPKIQEVRAIVRLTYNADTGLNAAGLLAAVTDDINRLADPDSESPVEMYGGEVAVIHEERDIYGTGEVFREDPIHLLHTLSTGGLPDPVARAIKLAGGSTDDTPTDPAQALIKQLARCKTTEEAAEGEHLENDDAMDAFILTARQVIKDEAGE